VRSYEKIKEFLSGIIGSKRVERKWKMMKDVVVQDLIELMRTLKQC
jgi:hypothetical protein